MFVYVNLSFWSITTLSVVYDKVVTFKISQTKVTVR